MEFESNTTFTFKFKKLLNVCNTFWNCIRTRYAYIWLRICDYFLFLELAQSYLTKIQIIYSCACTRQVVSSYQNVYVIFYKFKRKQKVASGQERSRIDYFKMAVGCCATRTKTAAPVQTGWTLILVSVLSRSGSLVK